MSCALLTARRLLVAGVAFAGARGISRVDVRIANKAWQPAVLNAPALSTMTWVQWQVMLPIAHGQGGQTVAVEARATDGHGHPQESMMRATYPDGAAGLHSVTVTL